jgi:DNA polymerase (family 10)
MKNHEIAELFTRFGQLLEMTDENVFKIRAYFKAAENIDALGHDIEEYAREERLCEIPGVGKALEEKIVEYLKTGKVQAYEHLTKEIPESLIEVMTIPSVGPKKAKLFFDKLQIKTVDDLAKAAADGKLAGLPGFKDKTIQNIVDGLAMVQAGGTRMTLDVAIEVAQRFINALKDVPGVKRIEIAGSLRRGKESIGDIDLLVDADDAAKVMDAFVHLPMVKSINGHGETKSSIVTREHVQVDLRVIPSNVFGAALLHLTGSQSFNVKARQLAIKKSMKVSEYGIFKLDGEKEKLLPCDTEEKCFKALGLRFIPPELREEIGEERYWNGGEIPDLITLNDIKGDLHMHSTYSDGRHSIAEMAAAAQALGYQYIAISDHSARLKIARGVSEEDLLKKIKEIEALNKTLKGFRVFCGSEVEIDSEGNIDYNEDTLARLDFVVASVHSGFEQSKEQITRRMIKACQNKFVRAIGHPTGRLIGRRDGYQIDLKEVAKTAADTGTCLEINAFPNRLDLDSANVYFARSLGVQFLIDTDSHAKHQLSYMTYGVGVARRGWLTAADVVNTKSLAQMEKWLKGKK